MDFKVSEYFAYGPQVNGSLPVLNDKTSCVIPQGNYSMQKSAVFKGPKFNNIIAELLNVKRIFLDLRTLKHDFTIADISNANHDYRLFGTQKLSKLNNSWLESEAFDEKKPKPAAAINSDQEIIEIDDSSEDISSAAEVNKGGVEVKPIEIDTATIIQVPPKKDANATADVTAKENAPMIQNKKVEKDSNEFWKLFEIIDLEKIRKREAEIEKQNAELGIQTQYSKKLRYGKKQDSGKPLLFPICYSTFKRRISSKFSLMITQNMSFCNRWFNFYDISNVEVGYECMKS